VTDLPPSIALGFEPGEALTMKRKPRPKTQPVVLMWMWRGIVANGVILTICIFCTYMLALWAYAGAFTTDEITHNYRDKCAIWKHDNWAPTMKFDCGMWDPCSSNVESNMYHVNCTGWDKNALHVPVFEAYPDELEDAKKVIAATEGGATGAIYSRNPDCTLCIDESIRRARTCAFISLVWAEGFRAYCSRSFENGVWVNTFNNPSMNKAVAMAQVTLILALFIPGLNKEVLGLYVEEIYGFGVFLAFVGAFACLVFCELYKYVGSKFIEEAELADYEEDEDGNVKSSNTQRYHDV